MIILDSRDEHEYVWLPSIPALKELPKYRKLTAVLLAQLRDNAIYTCTTLLMPYNLSASKFYNSSIVYTYNSNIHT